MLARRPAGGLGRGPGGVKVVIPEGWSARQIAERLEKSGLCPAADFLRVAANDRLEGYLFPTTYFFEPGLDAVRVAQRMHAEFDRRLAEEFARAEPKPRLTLHQALTWLPSWSARRCWPASSPWSRRSISTACASACACRPIPRSSTPWAIGRKA